jgi:pimeloyl-ACP methyl ester carboxylesterase
MRLIRISNVGGLLVCLCALAGAASAQERSMLPVTIDGEHIKLATITYKPEGSGPFPVLIFHHGSTDGSMDPAVLAQRFDPFILAYWFVVRGWAVVLPSRRGRGGSEGLYDEGISADRSQGFTCDEARNLAGAERASHDIDAATDAILALPFVDRSRFVVGGQSRGGILSIVWAGRHPDEPRGVINFVGGWIRTACDTASAVNQHLFTLGSTFPKPTLWLYGDHDRFYSLAHSRRNFESFKAAGGKGEFHEFEPTGQNGHQIFQFDWLWSKTMGCYLAELGLPHNKLPSRP